MEIPIKNLYYLLSYAWNRLEVAEKVSVAADDYDNLVNLFSRILINGTNALFKRGLDRSYIEIKEEYAGVRGKIVFKDSLNKQLFHQGKAVCEFDHFSSNVIQNQILKATIRKLTNFNGIERKLRNQLWDCYYRFSEIDDINIQLHHFNKVRIHKNNLHYDFLLKVSRLIIENAVLSEDNGKYEFNDFTRNETSMAYLFEDFVRNFYAKEQKQYKVRREDIKWQVIPVNGGDISLFPKMQTDISLESDNHKIIIDTKYYKETLSSQFGVEKYHSHNLYQLYSYLRNIESDHRNENNSSCKGILLYPTTQKEIDELYQLPNHQLRICTVDLAQDWRFIHDRLLNIINL